MILKKILKMVDFPVKSSKSMQCNCAVCDTHLDDGGVKFTSLFSKSSFNLNHEFKNPESDYVCHYCAVFFSKKNWENYCLNSGKDPCFPIVDGKKPFIANWMFFSHYFAKNDHRIVKNRQDWRGYLTNPPTPPFCFVLSTICKKHLIHKSEMAYDSEVFPIRFEDKIIEINCVDFANCLDALEKLYNAGLSKSSIRTGDYNTSMLLKVDRQLLHDNDSIIQQFRRLNPDYLAVCEFIGGKGLCL